MSVARGQLRHLGREHRRQRLDVCRVLRDQHLADTREGGRLRGDRGPIRGEHQHVDGRACDLRCTADALGGAGVQPGTVVFRNDQDLAHHTNPFFLSASTSSATSFTMTPFWRCGGGSTRTVLNAGASLSPKSPSPSVSSGFFFAFMMSGSFT
jgi:hypothetical protein